MICLIFIIYLKCFNTDSLGYLYQIIYIKCINELFFNDMFLFVIISVLDFHETDRVID